MNTEPARQNNAPERRLSRLRIRSKNHVVVFASFALLALTVFLVLGWVTAPKPPIAEYGDLDPAIVKVLDECYSAVRWSPRSGEAWGRLGIGLLNYKFVSEAQECLREAERRDPKNPRWPYFLSLSMFPENAEQGLSKLRHAVKLDGNKNAAPRNRLATILAEMGEYGEAREQFNQVLRKWPNDPGAVLGLGKIAFAQNQLDESLGYLQRAAGNRHTAKASRKLLVTIHRRQGNTSAADKIARELKTLPEDIPPTDPYELEASTLYTGRVALLDNAARLYRQGRYANALPIVQQCVGDYPNSVDARILLARIQMRHSNYQAAKDSWEKAIEMSPDAVEAHVQLGVTLLYLQDTERATACFQRAIQIDPNLSEAYHNLGLSHAASGQYNDAIEAFRTASELKPGFVDSYLGLADALGHTGDLDKARAALEKAYQLDPTDQRTKNLRRRYGVP